MPLCRYHIRSAHALADPELRRAADSDDSEAVLEAVAMAGLVGFLRQLGDLAQFAAEMFHDLHEEVLATTARGHSLMSRVQQLEAEVPALEKVFLSQTHHSSYFTNRGIEWHPNLQSEQNLVTRGDLPRFIMDSYEECRGPPRLFLLDKFDVAGAGACLKRYTDPSFFMESASSGTATVEVQREKKNRNVKQKKGARLGNGETPEVVPSHGKLHQLFLQERIENACRDPARLVKLKKKQLNGSAVEAKAGKSYMEKILDMSSPDHKMVCGTSFLSQRVKLESDDTSESGIKILEISSITPMKRSLGNENTSSSPNEQELGLNPYSEMDRDTDGYIVEVNEQISGGVTEEMSSNNLNIRDEAELVFDEQNNGECSLDSYHSDDVASEVDDYMDALATMESELETDNECRPMKNLLNIQHLTDSNGKGEPQQQAQFSDSQSFGDSSSSEEMSSFEQDRNEEHNEVQGQLSDSPSTGTSWASDDNSSFRRSRNEENYQLQPQFSDSQSIGNCTSEIENMTSNQLSPAFGLQRTYCREFVMHDDGHVQGEVISDSRPVSSGSCLMDSGHVLLSSDHGSASPARSQSDETPSGHVKLKLRIEDSEEKKCLVESIVARSDALYPIRDDACPVVSFDNNSLNNLNVCEPYASSNALLQVSNELTMAHEGECGDQSEIEVLLTESHVEYSSEILVSGDDGLQVEDPICPSMNVDLYPETSSKSSFTEELCFDSNKLDSAEVEVLPPDQQVSFEEVPRILPGDEISGSACSLDLVEDDGHIEHPSSHIISSAMSNLTKLEESLSTFADRCEKEMIVNEADSRESLTELTAQKVVDQPEITSTDVLLNMNRSVPCDPSDSGMWNNIKHSSLGEKIQYISSINDPKMESFHSEIDSQRSSGQRINPTKHAMDPLKPLIPDLLPKATKTNLEEMPPMPPLPPLPPMQWRTGKVQHAFPFTQREDIEVSLTSLQPIHLNKPDDRSQIGLLTSEKETLPYQNSFLSIMAVESNVHQHSSGFSVGISAHPVAIPFQFPVMVNEANGQHNFLVPEQSEIQHPILTFQDRPPLVVASEGEMVLNPSSCPSSLPAECIVSEADPIFQQEKPSQSPSQLMEGTDLEVEKDIPGELHLEQPAECPVSGDDPISPKEKPTQSPSQLMEETSLEAKTLKQSSVNLETEQEDPSFSPVSPQSLEHEQTNHSLLSSEEEMAFPLATSVQTSEHCTVMPNGKPKNKRPLPPEDPVIDPVAALDKSRLRKVTDRVIPPRAPKGDERDSLLEMIRSKSFNLRSAAVQRPPSIQGPKTNLRVAAILEKANSIRQALAGSDEDDDTDSWSDS